MNIVVVGLGYVGLPLALQYCRSAVRVTGVDVNPAKVASLLRGESCIRHIPAAAVRTAVPAERVRRPWLA